MNKNINYSCRVCSSKKIEEFKIVHYGFLTKKIIIGKVSFALIVVQSLNLKLKKPKLRMLMVLIEITKIILILNPMMKKFYLQ